MGVPESLACTLKMNICLTSKSMFLTTVISPEVLLILNGRVREELRMLYRIWPFTLMSVSVALTLVITVEAGVFS